LPRIASRLRRFAPSSAARCGRTTRSSSDPNADTPQYRSAQDAEFALNLLAEMMTEAGLDPAAVYAFKRTGGLFPTESLPLTDEELEEWAAAIDDYHERIHPKHR